MEQETRQALDEKLRNEINNTPDHNFYRGNSDSDLFLERQFLVEPDYRHTAIIEAGKLPNQTTQELLQSADKIFNWLMAEKNEKAEKRAKALEPKWKTK